MFTGKGTRCCGSWRNRGAEGIIAKLSRRGVELHLSADRSGLVVTGAGGRAARGTALTPYIAAAEVARPLLLPYLRDGRPPACAVSPHPEPVEAVTVAAGAPALAWCGQCSGGAA